MRVTHLRPIALPSRVVNFATGVGVSHGTVQRRPRAESRTVGTIYGVKIAIWYTPTRGPGRGGNKCAASRGMSHEALALASGVNRSRCCPGLADPTWLLTIVRPMVKCNTYVENQREHYVGFKLYSDLHWRLWWYTVYVMYIPRPRYSYRTQIRTQNTIYWHKLDPKVSSRLRKRYHHTCVLIYKYIHQNMWFMVQEVCQVRKCSRDCT